ncbi:transporter [Streptomyces sp. NPDC051940]|uniref:sodium:solute symporter family transporter n=1 Tax=Streptomyces sp. NPDC051940 TaxID=3155675 RepID=UPI0034192858
MNSLLDSSNRSVVLAAFSAFVVVCLMLCVITGADEDDRALVRSDSRRLRAWQQGVAMGGDTTTVATVTVLVGMVATFGFDGIGLMLGSLVGVVLLLLLVAEPLRHHAVLTPADLLDARGSGGPGVRVSLGVVTLIVCLLLLVVQLVAVGNLAAALFGQVTPQTRIGCIIVFGTLMTAFAVTGGIRGTGVIMIAKSALAIPVLLVVAWLVLHRFGWNPARLLDSASAGAGLGRDFLKPGNYTGDGRTGALNGIGQTLGMSLATMGMPAVLMRVISTKSPRGARIAGRWMLSELSVLYGALAVVGLGAAALVGPVLRDSGTGVQAFTPLLVAQALGRDGLLVAAVACVLFPTALAAVVDMALAAGMAVWHDVLGGFTRNDDNASVSRWAAALTCALAIVLSVFAVDLSLVSLSALWLTICGAALTPVLLYALYWPGFTARGALWCLWGGTALSVFLIAVSPYASGVPGAVFPGQDFRLWDVTAPAVVAGPAGFLLGWLGSVTDPQRGRRAGRAGHAPISAAASSADRTSPTLQ